MRNRANPTGKVHERQAAAAVELAVLLPFLVFMFVISVDFARIFYYSQVVQNCARQGALYASDPKAPAANLYTSVQQAALADAPDLSPQPNVTSATGNDKAGNSHVSVTVTWPFQTLTAFPGVTPKVTISHTVQMRAAP